MRPSPPILDVLDCAACDAVLLTYGGAGQALRDQVTDRRNIRFSQFVAASPLTAHVRAGNVLPIVAANDLVKGFGSNTVVRANVLAVVPASDAVEDGYNICFGQFGRAGLAALILAMQAGIVSMLNIFRVRDPLKIAEPVVRFIAVDVVGHVLRCGRWANESLKDKAMNYAGLLFHTGSDRGNGQIASLHKFGTQYPVRTALRASCKSFDPTAVTGRVVTFPAGNFFPTFHGPNLAAWD